jgi:stage IV sporulation protein FB
MIFVTNVRGVPLFVHWSVPAIALFVLGMFVHELLVMLTIVVTYIAILVVHEVGHQLAARRARCGVLAIEIYPLHGLCRFTEPATAFDEAAIAWGGVLAQFAVAIPFAIWTALAHFKHFGAVAVAIAMLGTINPAMALFNLIPVRPLDGAKAWPIVPMLYRRARRPRAQSAIETFDEAVRNARRR